MAACGLGASRNNSRLAATPAEAPARLCFFWSAAAFPPLCFACCFVEKRKKKSGCVFFGVRRFSAALFCLWFVENRKKKSGCVFFGVRRFSRRFVLLVVR